jgi:hypothetical protein
VAVSNSKKENAFGNGEIKNCTSSFLRPQCKIKN